MARVIAAVALAALMLVAASADARVLVTLAPGTDPAAALHGATPATGTHARVPALRLHAVQGDARTAALLARRPGVLAAEPEGESRLRDVPDDPALHAAGAGDRPLQWTLARQGFFEAWDAATGDEALVAVIDSGIDATHPDLASRIAGVLDLDDRPGTGPPTVDEDGHGTHVASLACAATGDGAGIAGAGRRCRLLVVKSDLLDSSVAAGIVAATDAGAHAIVMAFGDDGRTPSRALADAVAYAAGRGVPMVAAAADEPITEQGEPAGLLQPPGTGPELAAGRGLVVTAADEAGRRAAFAGRGDAVSLAAHGSATDTGGIIGAYPAASTPRESARLLPVPQPGCGCRTSVGGDDRYAFLAGTSMAAPQVAAVAALLRAGEPELPLHALLARIKLSAANAAFDPETGWGVLDAAAALGTARMPDSTPPRAASVVARARTAPRGARVAVELRARDVADAPGVQPSGVGRYVLYRALDRGRPRLVARTRSGRATVTIPRRARRLVKLYLVAIDRAGNRQPFPARPSAVIRVRRPR